MYVTRIQNSGRSLRRDLLDLLDARFTSPVGNMETLSATAALTSSTAVSETSRMILTSPQTPTFVTTPSDLGQNEVTQSPESAISFTSSSFVNNADTIQGSAPTLKSGPSSVHFDDSHNDECLSSQESPFNNADSSELFAASPKVEIGSGDDGAGSV